MTWKILPSPPSAAVVVGVVSEAIEVREVVEVPEEVPPVEVAGVVSSSSGASILKLSRGRATSTPNSDRKHGRVETDKTVR